MLYEVNPEDVHMALFGHMDPQKGAELELQLFGTPEELAARRLHYRQLWRIPSRDLREAYPA